jgi:broad specificity phosphatase PhoE
MLILQMTRVMLIQAGPTPWDEEERVTGNHTLPLTDEARTRIAQLVETLPMVDSVYRPSENEACEETARMIASRFSLRLRDNADLDAWNLGLWQGLRRDDVKQRYPRVYQQWDDAPESVVPPEGESFIDAIDRLRGAVRKILRRNRGYTVALALRPISMQIVSGLLHRENPRQIASRLQNNAEIETIELDDEVLKEI